MATINLHVVGEVCRFSAFEAAHFILTMRKLGAKQSMQFCLLSHWYWFLVITKNAETDCSKGISEGKQWRI